MRWEEGWWCRVRYIYRVERKNTGNKDVSYMFSDISISVMNQELLITKRERYVSSQNTKELDISSVGVSVVRCSHSPVYTVQILLITSNRSMFTSLSTINCSHAYVCTYLLEKQIGSLNISLFYIRKNLLKNTNVYALKILLFYTLHSIKLYFKVHCNYIKIFHTFSIFYTLLKREHLALYRFYFILLCLQYMNPFFSIISTVWIRLWISVNECTVSFPLDIIEKWATSMVHYTISRVRPKHLQHQTPHPPL